MHPSRIRRIIYKILRFLFQFPRICFFKLLSDNHPVHNRSRCRQPVLFTGRGSISLGHCNLGVWPSPFFFSGYIHIEARHEGASVEISNNVWINNNACIIADRTKIFIGERTLVGPNLTVFDSDFHGIHPDKRLSNEYDAMPVVIGDNVFIGANVTILKGVTIGDGSIIGSGSVVTKSIPAFVIAGGIPAKVLQRLQY